MSCHRYSLCPKVAKDTFNVMVAMGQQAVHTFDWEELAGTLNTWAGVIGCRDLGKVIITGTSAAVWGSDST